MKVVLREFAAMKNFTVWNWFLFAVTVVFILALMLMDSGSLDKLYLYCAQMLPGDVGWVKKHLTGISNAGHLVSCFVLTCLGFSVFRESYLKAVGSVAGLAVLGELLQEFTATRQAKVEDVALGFAGILLASGLLYVVRGRRGELI